MTVVAHGASERLARLTAAGSLDPTFNGGAPLATPYTTTPTSMLVDSDGAVELLGYTETGNQVPTLPTRPPVYDCKVWRYTSAGTLATQWGNGGAIDVGPDHSVASWLFATNGGATLIVTLQLADSPRPSSAYNVDIVRLTATGQIDTTLGGAAGLQVRLPFGGTTYAPGTIADLQQNSLEPYGVIQRTDRTLLFSGSVSGLEATPTEGGLQPVAWFNGLALAALGRSYRLDPTFNGAARPRVSVHVTGTQVTPAGIAVQVDSSDPAISVVTVTAHGKTIAKGSVPSFSNNKVMPRAPAAIQLTPAGKRIVGRRVHVGVSVSTVDLAGNHTIARTAATLAS